MYKPTFGTKNQINFRSESEYYEFLGFLAKSDGTTMLVWEDNDLSGAWSKEGRILVFYLANHQCLMLIFYIQQALVEVFCQE